jgi:hypothetical protein
MRDCGGFDAVSKTVDGRKVVRGFESLPLRFCCRFAGTLCLAEPLLSAQGGPSRPQKRADSCSARAAHAHAGPPRTRKVARRSRGPTSSEQGWCGVRWAVPDREAHRRLVLPRKLRERWQRRGHNERLSGDEVTLVLVMSYHAHTFGSPRLSRNSRELPRHLCGTLEHREDPSFGVDDQELHDYVSPARHRRRCNAAVPIS